MYTLGSKIIAENEVWTIIADGFNHENQYGLLCVHDDTRQFFLEDEIEAYEPDSVSLITPESSPLVKDRRSGRTVINYGCYKNTHKPVPFRLGQVLKDRYGNILTVLTRGDVVYYYAANIDSNVYQVENSATVIGTIDTICSITGEPLQEDYITVHTKNGDIHMNAANKPEFVMKSRYSGEWYTPQFFHLVLGKDYENLYIGFDELHYVQDDPEIEICTVTGIPFYIADERDIVKKNKIHPIIIDQFVVKCPISNKTGLKQNMLEGYMHGVGIVYFHPSVKDKLIEHNGTFGTTENDFFFVEDLGEYFSKCKQNDFFRANNGKWYSSREVAPLCGVHPYGFKPTPRFQGEGKKYLGLEMEFHRCGESNSRADAIINNLNQIMYAKHDGSLRDGMEFITHPCTPEFHLQQVDYDGFINRVLGHNGQASIGAGLHIHVNRDFFVNNLAIAKLIRFAENNFDRLMNFTGRTSDDSGWCNKYGYNVHELAAIYDTAKRSGERRKAINICPKHTVEFRIFRSTDKPQNIRAYIQFVDIATDLANMASVKYIGWSNIARLAKTRKYNELIELMKEKGLIKGGK